MEQKGRFWWLKVNTGVAVLTQCFICSADFWFRPISNLRLSHLQPFQGNRVACLSPFGNSLAWLCPLPPSYETGQQQLLLYLLEDSRRFQIANALFSVKSIKCGSRLPSVSHASLPSVGRRLLKERPAATCGECRRRGRQKTAIRKGDFQAWAWRSMQRQT